MRVYTATNQKTGRTDQGTRSTLSDMNDNIKRLNRTQLIYVIEMRLPLSYQPPRLIKQGKSELLGVVYRAIRDGNITAEQVYAAAQFMQKSNK